MRELRDYLGKGKIRIVASRSGGDYLLLVDDRARRGDRSKAPVVVADVVNKVLWPPRYLQTVVKFNRWNPKRHDEKLLESTVKLKWVSSGIAGVSYFWEEADRLFLGEDRTDGE